MIKKLIVILLLIPPLLVSCSPYDVASDDEGKTVGNSCQDKEYYVAQGKKYHRLATANGYKAEGQASIYKGNTQGRGAGCPAIDMNAYTAAHRTLPLPTHVKLTNKSNGKSVVVKVNDRGPSLTNSIIQVTPVVASLLGANSSFPVRIQSLSHMKSVSEAVTKNKSRGQEKTIALRNVPVKKIQPAANAASYYIVIGTYASQEEALDKFVRLSSIGITHAAMETRKRKSGVLHMVRIGPFYRQDEIDRVKNKLINDGLVKFTVVRN